MHCDGEDRHPIRMQIKKTLRTHSKPLSASDIALICMMPVARIEYHVDVLERAGAILRVRSDYRQEATTDLYRVT